MYKSAYSYIEVVVALFILMVVLFPLLRLSGSQYRLYQSVNMREKQLSFFEKLVDAVKLSEYEELEDIFHISIKDYSQLSATPLANYDLFSEADFKGDSYEIKLNIEKELVDFNIHKERALIIEISLKAPEGQYETKLIKFK